MYVVDTNVVSELRKARLGRADRHVVAWAAGIVPSALFISAITVLELELGVLLAGQRDVAAGAVLRAWLEDQVLPAFAGRVLPIDSAVACSCARLHVPDRREERGALIAATALVHGMTIVTRNVADFAPTSVRIINPWLTVDDVSRVKRPSGSA